MLSCAAVSALTLMSVIVRDPLEKGHHNIDDDLEGEASHIWGLAIKAINTATTMSALLICAQNTRGQLRVKDDPVHPPPTPQVGGRFRGGPCLFLPRRPPGCGTGLVRAWIVGAW